MVNQATSSRSRTTMSTSPEQRTECSLCSAASSGTGSRTQVSPPLVFVITLSGNTVITPGGLITTWLHFRDVIAKCPNLPLHGNEVSPAHMRCLRTGHSILLSTRRRNSFTIPMNVLRLVKNPNFEPRQSTLQSGMDSYRYWFVRMARRAVAKYSRTEVTLKDLSALAERYCQYLDPSSPRYGNISEFLAYMRNGWLTPATMKTTHHRSSQHGNQTKH